MPFKIGDTVSFNFNATSELTGNITDFAGKTVVLYFYPKDNTSGCTQESQDFTATASEFERANAVILGLSRESLKSHENFKAKVGMPFELISDPDETICTLFDVMKEKSMYGRKYMGIERSTFIIDAKGTLVKEWRKLKIPGHVNEVLEAVKQLSETPA